MSTTEPKVNETSTDSPSESTADTQHEEYLPELSFEQARFAARPPMVRPRATRHRKPDQSPLTPPFEADGRNRAYVDWLEEQSMLHDATTMARQLAGKHQMWANPFAAPDPRAALHTASVWFAAYPLSMITEQGESFLGALGSEKLWEAFEKVGIDAIHTGPVKLAGGLDGWSPTPRPSSARCAPMRRSTGAPSSTTSSPGTRARVPTSGSPNSTTGTTPASTT